MYAHCFVVSCVDDNIRIGRIFTMTLFAGECRQATAQVDTY